MKELNREISSDSFIFPYPLMHVAWGYADRMESEQPLLGKIKT